MQQNSVLWSAFRPIRQIPQSLTRSQPLPSVAVGMLLEHPELSVLTGKGLGTDTPKVKALKTLELRDRPVILTAHESLPRS